VKELATRQLLFLFIQVTGRLICADLAGKIWKLEKVSIL